jgi:hypothetical protein
MPADDAGVESSAIPYVDPPDDPSFPHMYGEDRPYPLVQPINNRVVRLLDFQLRISRLLWRICSFGDMYASESLRKDLVLLMKTVKLPKMDAYVESVREEVRRMRGTETWNCTLADFVAGTNDFVVFSDDLPGFSLAETHCADYTTLACALDCFLDMKHTWCELVLHQRSWFACLPTQVTYDRETDKWCCRGWDKWTRVRKVVWSACKKAEAVPGVYLGTRSMRKCQRPLGIHLDSKLLRKHELYNDGLSSSSSSSCSSGKDDSGSEYGLGNQC